MSTEKQLTFEEVNAGIEQHRAAGKLQSLTATTSICEVYAIARPILVLASQTVFIPQTWRNIIKTLIAALDIICPQPK